MEDSGESGVDTPLDEMELELEGEEGDVEQRQKKSSRWQKEVWHLTKLPYFEELELEADEQFRVIKAGLLHSVLLRDLRPALLHWICELDKYINLYSRRFSKSDHVKLVRLIYRCMIMKDLEFRMVKACAHSLSVLLAKKELLSRSDLTLDWRPLYDIYIEITYKSLEDDGMLLLPNGLKVSLENCISHCRVYFGDMATRQILDEVRPYLCPWDESMMRAMNILCLFLPTLLTEDEHKQFGASLWLEEIWHWYCSVESHQSVWRSKACHLFARLARESPGFVDWTDRYDIICTHSLRALGLHLGQEQVPVGHGGVTFPQDAAATWFAYMLGGPNNGIQGHLSSMFRSLESYFHPSNLGNYTLLLLSFLYSLVQAICTRLHKERHRKSSPHPQVPERLRLTDKQLDDFVESVLPCALLCIFTKLAKQECGPSIFRCLSHLAPGLVLPAVLDTLYPSLESLTEPHRLLQSMNCLVAVIVPLIRDNGAEDQGRKRAALEVAEEQSGRPCRAHVISLMNAILPGLDPNDIGKSMVTFQVIGMICALVPIVDCSEAVHLRNDLTDEEKELCSATANFETIADQLMSRMFGMIEMSARGESATTVHGSLNAKTQAKFSIEENIAKSGIHSVFRTLVCNCSRPIYNVAVDRLYDFVGDHMFNSRVAAETVAEMISSAVTTMPAVSLPRFLGFLTKKIKSVITDETKKEEEVDSAVVWYLILLSKLFRVSGTHLVPLKDDILQLLALILPLTCKQAYELSSSTLDNVLAILTGVYVDVEACVRRSDEPLDKYLPIRHWARTVNKNSWQVKWHVPVDEELQLAQTILSRFVLTELDRLDNPEQLTREEMLRALTIVKAGVGGCSTVLPFFDTNQIALTDSQVPMHPFHYTTSPPTVTALTFGGVHGRKRILQTAHSLLDFLLKEREDDTRSLLVLTKIYRILLFFKGIDKGKYDKDLVGFNATKRMVADPIKGNKANIEPIVREFVVLQHYKRLLARSGYHFTESHLTAMRDMVRAGTSAYSVVRLEAQKVLDQCVQCFPYSYKLILDDVLPLLDNHAAISHEQFKGALYILLNGKRLCICVRQTWLTLLRVWPALVVAQHSEKPSVIALLEFAQNTVVDNLESFLIQFQFESECIDEVKALWADENEESVHRMAWPVPDSQMEAIGLDRQQKRNQSNRAIYYELIDKLTQLSEDTSLHWRHQDMAQSLLSLLIRRDMAFPGHTVRLFIRLLVNDSIKTRQMAAALIGAWLKMNKPKPVKIPFRPSVQLPNRGPGANFPIKYGFLADNRFLQYVTPELPATAEKWNETVFLDKPHWGFYSWPENVMIYGPSDEQKCCNRTAEELNDVEQYMLQQFSDKDYLDKFVAYMSLEDKKGEDQYNPLTFALFHGIFRNYSDIYVQVFRGVLEKLVKSEKEGEQRFAAEIVSGMVHGSKLWTFDRLQALWKWLTPVLNEALENVTTETAGFWGTSLATIVGNRDPRRLAWLFELLFALCLKPTETSFQQTTRYFLLQGALNQGEWRVMELWHRLNDMCRPHLAQTYQNFRDRLGSCMATIVWFDINGVSVDEDCYREGLRPVTLNGVLTQFEDRMRAVSRQATHSPNTTTTITSTTNSTSTTSSNCVTVEEVDSTNEDENGRKEGLLVLKTLLRYLQAHWSHGFVILTGKLLELVFPLLSHFENDTSDDELKQDARLQLRHFMAGAIITDSNLATVLLVCQQTLDRCKWWKSRVSTVKYLQAAVFSNFFLFDRSLPKSRVREMIFSMIANERLEVREAAAETLAGFFHCAYFQVTQQFTKQFEEWAKSRDMVERHAGVLALAAIVRAFPYTVPDFLPNVLMTLCPHASEKQPIQSTVKKTLQEFKRTHQDSWHEHKERFSDDQLLVLTELLVSPNYYV